jgi:hypothetical protein
VNVSLPDLRIEKIRVPATVTLSDGRTMQGCVFVCGFTATHSGPESVKDLMNDGPGFFPLEVEGPNGPEIHLLNRGHVLFVTLASDEEVRQAPGAEVATRHRVAIVLDDGTRLDGLVPVARPRGRDRLSDHTRWGEAFWYLEVPPTAVIVNASRVIELVERDQHE